MQVGSIGHREGHVTCINYTSANITVFFRHVFDTEPSFCSVLWCSMANVVRLVVQCLSSGWAFPKRGSGDSWSCFCRPDTMRYCHTNNVIVVVNILICHYVPEKITHLIPLKTRISHPFFLLFYSISCCDVS